MINYGKQFIDSKDIRAVVKILKRNLLTQGPEIENIVPIHSNTLTPLTPLCCLQSIFLPQKEPDCQYSSYRFYVLLAFVFPLCFGAKQNGLFLKNLFLQ